MTQHDDTVALRHMLDYAHTATRLADGRSRTDLDSDEMLQLALTRTVEVIGEAAKRVSAERRNMHPQIPWREITGTRDRLIHAYDVVNLDILWRIVQDELPPLIAELQRIVQAEDK